MRNAIVRISAFAGEILLEIYLLICLVELFLRRTHTLSPSPQLIIQQSRKWESEYVFWYLPPCCCFLRNEKKLFVFFAWKMFFSIFVMPFFLVTFVARTKFSHSFMHRSYKFINIWLIGITASNSAWISSQKKNQKHHPLLSMCNASTQQLWSCWNLLFQNTHNGESSKSQTRTNILFIFYLILRFPKLYIHFSILMFRFPSSRIVCVCGMLLFVWESSLRQTLLCVFVCSRNSSRAPLHCMDFIYLWQSKRKEL